MKSLIIILAALVPAYDGGPGQDPQTAQSPAKDVPLMGDDPNPPLAGSIFDLAYAKDGSVLVTGGQRRDVENGLEGDLRIWDAKSGRLLRRLKHHSDEIIAVALSSDGRYLASSGNDCDVCLWDLRAERPPLVLQHEDPISALAFSPDDRTLATGGTAGVVRIRDMQSHRIIRSFTCNENECVQCLIFSHGGMRIAAGTLEGLIRVWEVATGKPLATFSGQQRGINSLILSPDGRMLASSGYDGTVRLWDANTGASVKVLRPPPGSETDFGPEHNAGKIAFSPDGSILAAVGSRGSVRLWDVRKGLPIRMLKDDDFIIMSIAFSPDGKFLATGTSKGLRFWDWSKGQGPARELGAEPVSTPDRR